MTENVEFLPDFYHFLVSQTYFLNDNKEKYVFDVFFREIPFNGGYTVFAGLQPLLKTLSESFFTSSTLSFLKEKNCFTPEFLSYLSTFKFSGNIFSVREGELIFPHEPFMRFEGNALETHLIEGIVLNSINFQTLIATKAARIFYETKGKPFSELGLRRAYGYNGALFATRSAFIGGASATSNVIAANMFNIPITGSMSHSYVIAHNSELSAFINFGTLYPQNCIFLLDTYNVLHQGLPNAIKAFLHLNAHNILAPGGIKGIRIDSGDLEYLSKKIRESLDSNGLQDVKIFVSNELDEYVIHELVNSSAPIDSFGVGTNLVTGGSNKSLGGVYKMAAVEKEGIFTPKMKISNNAQKITIPGRKNIIRFFSKQNKIMGDIIFLEEERDLLFEKINNKEPIVLKHPYYSHITSIFTDYAYTKVMLLPVMENGELIANFPLLSDVREHFIENFSFLHNTHKRLINPHIYKVGLTENLFNLYNDLFNKSQSKENSP